MEASVRHGRNFNAARAKFESNASAVPSGFGRRTLSGDGLAAATTPEPSPSGSNRSSNRNDDEDGAGLGASDLRGSAGSGLASSNSGLKGFERNRVPYFSPQRRQQRVASGTAGAQSQGAGGNGGLPDNRARGDRAVISGSMPSSTSASPVPAGGMPSTKPIDNLTTIPNRHEESRGESERAGSRLDSMDVDMERHRERVREMDRERALRREGDVAREARTNGSGNDRALGGREGVHEPNARHHHRDDRGRADSPSPMPPVSWPRFV